MTNYHNNPVQTVLANLLAQARYIQEQDKKVAGELHELTLQSRTLCQVSSQMEQSILDLQNRLSKLPEEQKSSEKPVSTEDKIEAPSCQKEEFPPSDSFDQHSKATTTESWELALGMKWFSRIGIGALLVGVAMGLNYTFPFLPPVAKITLGWLLSILLLFTGNKLLNRFPILGRILQGGAVSTGYISLYSMFFFPSVQLFDNSTLGLLLLAAYVISTMFFALKIESQTVAILSLIFGYYTASYSGYQWIAFISTGMLGIATGIIGCYRPDWNIIRKGALIGAAGTLLYWNSYSCKEPQLLGSLITISEQEAYLLFNFLLFHVLSFFPWKKGDVALNIMNTFGFYVLYGAILGSPLHPGALELSIAAVHIFSLCILSIISMNKESSALMQSFLIMGLSFLGLAMLNMFDGDMAAALLATEALAFGLLSLRENFSKTYRIFSYIFWGLACFSGLFYLVDVTYGTYSASSLILTAGWVSLAGLILEHKVYRYDGKWLSFAVMAIASFLFCVSLVEALPSHWITVSFVLTGFTLLATGFLFQLKKYRWTALVWLAVAAFHLLIVDLVFLGVLYKIVLFITLGIGLLAASYGYHLLSRKQSNKE